MKKIRYIFLGLILILLSGCTATYEITIKNNKINEKVTIIELNQSVFDKEMDTGWTIRESFDLYSKSNEFSEEGYKVKSLTNNSQLGLEYKSESMTSIINSTFLNLCYSNATVKNIDGIVTIDTGANFECYDYYDNLENIKVVLKTNHEVVSTNAHEISGNKYVWNIDKNSDKNISISYYEMEEKKGISLTAIILVSILVICGLVVAYILFKKNKESNSI